MAPGCGCLAGWCPSSGGVHEAAKRVGKQDLPFASVLEVFFPGRDKLTAQSALSSRIASASSCVYLFPPFPSTAKPLPCGNAHQNLVLLCFPIPLLLPPSFHPLDCKKGQPRPDPQLLQKQKPGEVFAKTKLGTSRREAKATYHIPVKAGPYLGLGRRRHE